MRRTHLAIIVVLLIIVAGAAIWTSREISRHVADQLTTPEEKFVDLGAIVTQIRGLNRLETASMHVVYVSTVTQSYQYVPNSLSGDSLTFLAAGDVVAGVDLATLAAGDVYRQQDGSVVVRLPSAQVLITKIDNRESRVLNRSTGMFRHADAQLEGRARLYSEGGIRNEAIKKGLLPLAAQNAQTRIAGLLHAAGVERIEFIERANGPAEKH